MGDPRLACRISVTRVALRIRACEPGRQTPVAIVTGDQCIDDAVISEFRDLGAEVKFKPLWIEDLVDVARSLVGSRRQLN